MATGAASRWRRRRRSSWPVACSPARGSRTASSGSPSSARTRCRALKREHLGIDEATDVLSFPIDGARAARRPGVPRQLGDVVLCPQVVGDGVAAAARARAPAPARLRPRGRDGGARGADWPSRPRVRSGLTHRAAPRDALARRELQLRGRGDHPRPPHAAEHADPLRRARWSCSSPRSAIGVDQARADRPAPRDRVRADRGDDQLRDRGGDRRRHDLVRPDGEAGEGHRRRRGADRDRSTRSRSATSSSPARSRDRSARLLDRLRDAPAQLTLIALVVTVILVIATKAWTGRGRRCAAGFRPATPRSRSRAGWRPR